MISKKLKNSEEKKTFVEKNLKIIFLAIFALLIFPSLISASCGATCMTIGAGGGCDRPVRPDENECNYGVTPGCCGCFRQYYAFNADDVGGICKSGESCFVTITDNVWYKSHKFPDTDDYNGRPCAVFSANWLWELNCFENGRGVWDASERKCIQCDGKLENKVCGSAGTKSTETCKDSNSDGIPDDNDHDGVPDYCISLGCAVEGNKKCETACDVSVSPKCDDKTPGTPGNPGDPCGNGGHCDENCQCVGEVVSLCGNGALDGGEDCDIGHDLTPGTADDIDAACPGKCQADCKCPAGLCKTGPSYNTCQEEGIKCPTCSEQLIGGLVPCGRTCDDPCTAECECEPCTLCHLFVLFKRIVDFLAKDILFPLAVLMIIIGGVMFLTAAGSPERIGTAKKILTSTVMGLVIIFLAWLIVDTIIMVLTPANSPFRNWNEIDCPLPEETSLPEEELPPGCTCTDWVDVGCGTGGCAGTEMHKTRTCNPAGCAEETGCFADITCGAHTIPGCPSCILCP
jgi:hypothetical protein